MMIDYYHILSPFREDIENDTKSVMTKTFGELLTDRAVFDNTFLPNHVVTTFESQFTVQLRKNLSDIVSFIYQYLNLQPSNSDRFVCINLESIFAPELSVQSNGKGWNMIGNYVSNPYSFPIQKPNLFLLIDKLYTVFRQRYTLSEYIGIPLPELFQILKDIHPFATPEDFRLECFEHQKKYPNTLVEYIMSRLSYKTRLWTDEVILD